MINTNAAVKLFIGLIFIVIGLWLLVPSSMVPSIKPSSVGGVTLNWLPAFITVLKGFIPPFLILIGVLIVWIESEELKAPEVPEVEEFEDEDFDLEEEVEEPEAEEEKTKSK
ncbi:MAG: hypothetical protein ABEK36_05600 [Candidatus Aenigmatarchaeota archaeon]